MGEGTMQKEWELLCGMVLIDKDYPEDRMLELRRMFYAGAVAMLTVTSEAVVKHKGDPDAGAREVKRLGDETIQAFLELSLLPPGQ